MLWAAWVRSPEANAKIVSIDASAARARPGVRAVYTNEDLDMEAGLPMAWVPPGVEVKTPDHWVLAKGEVKHVGDPVALMIGDERYAVVDAIEDVSVEYESLPVITDPEQALEPARRSCTPTWAPTRSASGPSAAAISRPASPRPTSSSSGASSTIAPPAPRSSRVGYWPNIAPTA